MLPSELKELDYTVEALDAFCSRKTNPKDYPLAESVEENALVYDGERIRNLLRDGVDESHLKNELCRVLRDGPGVFVVKRAFADVSVVDRCTEVLREIIAEERSAGQSQGDHFGSNERVWNSLQKVCLRDPGLSIDYFGNPILAAACEAWLGPAYQMTAQVNNVKPGSSAQSVHRDYHLGFQPRETIERYPIHAQVMSQYLTLQAAIAHGDMPKASGPTFLLPHSHHFPAGYLAYSQPEFQAYFEANRIQLPMGKGDMLFLSPAVFHAAGANVSEKDRFANLLQISSAFGRTMETIDHDRMVEAVYPVLAERVEAGSITEREIQDAVAAVADGYAFPKNLDSDPPIEGNAPETGQQLLHRAVKERWVPEELYARMSAYGRRREP
jgi:ectoine hydroxylase-related dioxygenase (phytanoyl-CoA dioxygenase family)